MSRRPVALAWCALAAAAWLAAGSAEAQTVSGVVFEDRDADGIRDPGEPPVPGVLVELLGASGAGAVDQSARTAVDGGFAFTPGNGCYLLRPRDPTGWRPGPSRADGLPQGSPGYLAPAGIARFAKLDQGLDHLRAGSLRYASMGDSIAWNWNVCFYTESFWYSKQLRSRLACAASGATVTLDQDAVKGQHTDDLLVDDTADGNNVFRAIDRQPHLITISMIGNDLLGVDPGNAPTQQETDAAVEELLDARRNLQEALSTLVSEIPGADVAINTLYDNLTYNCDSVATSDFHREWLPIVNRILRELAWGQARRVSVIEARAEFAREDLAGACTGFEGLICRDIFQLDLIHPDNEGYQVLREKAWEAAGGISLGPGDVLGRTSQTGADHGYLRRVRRLLPTSWETRDGATVTAPEAALDDQDGGAAAAIGLGVGTEELRLSGFPDWYDEIRIVKTVAGVRYATAGDVTDDFYRMEASIGGEFAPPPGHAYTVTDWNFATPLVGGGGPNRPVSNPDYPSARLLAVPEVASPREVTATLTKNPVPAPGGAEYQWPPVTHEELATTAIRVVAAPVAATAGNDPYAVRLDAAWLDLYGWEAPRPAEVSGVALTRLADGTLEVAFDELAGAARYNLYLGRLSSLGAYDHGAGAQAGPLCGAPTSPAGDGRLKIVVAAAAGPPEDAYALVTAHVDDVESPAGHASDGVEIDRSQSSCR